MDINLLFKIAAIGILVAVFTSSISTSRQRRSSNDDNIGRISNCINDGNKRNKRII